MPDGGQSRIPDVFLPGRHAPGIPARRGGTGPRRRLRASLTLIPHSLKQVLNPGKGPSHSGVCYAFAYLLPERVFTAGETMTTGQFRRWPPAGRTPVMGWCRRCRVPVGNRRSGPRSPQPRITGCFRGCYRLRSPLRVVHKRMRVRQHSFDIPAARCGAVTVVHQCLCVLRHAEFDRRRGIPVTAGAGGLPADEVLVEAGAIDLRRAPGADCPQTAPLPAGARTAARCTVAVAAAVRIGIAIASVARIAATVGQSGQPGSIRENPSGWSGNGFRPGRLWSTILKSRCASTYSRPEPGSSASSARYRPVGQGHRRKSSRRLPLPIGGRTSAINPCTRTDP